MQSILELWLFKKAKLEKNLTNEEVFCELEKRPTFRYWRNTFYIRKQIAE
jgi:hypothetical protein